MCFVSEVSSYSTRSLTKIWRVTRTSTCHIMSSSVGLVIVFILDEGTSYSIGGSWGDAMDDPQLWGSLRRIRGITP